MNSHYDLKALDEQGRRRWLWAETLNLILERLNALENYAGESLSRWYGTDPRTGVFYGDPAIGSFAHLRIDYTGSPERCYLRERVDQLREKIGAPPFPWKYTPGINDFDTPPHRLCGPQAAGWLEMLEAIGRKCGGGSYSNYKHHFKRLVNGKVEKEWDDPDGPYEQAIFQLDYEKNELNRYDVRVASYEINLNGVGIPRINLGTYEPIEERRIDTLTITIGYSEYAGESDEEGSAEKDWVENEGGNRVILLNGTFSNVSMSQPRIEGYKLYHWDEGAYDHLECGGSSVNPETFEVTVIECAKTEANHQRSYGEDDKWVEFSPGFTIGNDGSVTPQEYDISEAYGDGGRPSELSDMIDLLHIPEAKQHCTMEHMKSLLAGTINSGAMASWINGIAWSHKLIGIHTSYFSEPTGTTGDGNGWLLWAEPYIPQGQGGYPNNLKAGGSL